MARNQGGKGFQRCQFLDKGVKVLTVCQIFDKVSDFWQSREIKRGGQKKQGGVRVI